MLSVLPEKRFSVLPAVNLHFNNRLVNIFLYLP